MKPRSQTVQLSSAQLNELRTGLDTYVERFPEALTALVAAVEAKHVATKGHSARVSELSGRIAHRLALQPERLTQLRHGALLHDIGKIGVPDAVLQKPGPLTSDERERVEEHPVTGWEIVRQAPSLATVLPAIRYHHEKVDGTGYPDRLRGDEIPLEARIVAVADVWDALTSDRDYRPAWTPQRALAHIIAGAGSHFDAYVVDLFVAMMAESRIYPERQAGEPEAVAAAGDACHPSHGYGAGELHPQA